jgi:hypothetical protein
MSSLADLPEVIGFFSYSREDDEAFEGTLSALRDAIQRELSAQLGRSRTTFRLWQDQKAIAPGKLWEAEIKTAVEQAVFFIPIVTPRAVSSHYCKFEFEAFLARERTLGRTDLVFPLLYIGVPALANEAQWRNDPVLSIIGARQYVDWRPFRHSDVRTTAVREAIERFCDKIVEALREPWVSPEERRKQQEIEDRQRAEEEKRRAEAARLEDEKRQAEAARLEDEKRQAAAARLEDEKRQAEAARLEDEKRQAAAARLEDEKRQAEAARLKDEKRRVEEEKKRAEAARLEEERRAAMSREAAEEGPRTETVRQAWQSLRKQLGVILASLALIIVAVILVGREGDHGQRPVDPGCSGLRITKIAPTRSADGVVIEGDITNAGSTARDVPRLRVTLRDPAEKETQYTIIDPPVDRLAPGKTAHFKTSFAHVDEAATGVLVTFYSC